jgi:hypothetical protein
MGNPDQYTIMRVITDMHRKNSGFGENECWYTGFREGEVHLTEESLTIFQLTKTFGT